MKIIALAGGGIRGILTARLLDRLQDERCFLLAEAELLAGTSVGGIIALALAHGLAPGEIVTLMRDMAEKVFVSRDWWDTFGGRLDEMVRADYSGTPLRTLLLDVFGTARLGDLKTRVLIPTFDLDNKGKDGHRCWKPKYLHNFPGPDSDAETLVVDAAMRTSAAPTFFPTYQGYIDGGLVDNFPAMSALAQAIRETGVVASHAMLGITTGAPQQFVVGENMDWGVKQWVASKFLIDIVFDGMNGRSAFQARQILADRFHLVDPVLDEPIGLDSIDKIPKLLAVADALDLTEAVAWVDDKWGVRPVG